MGYLTTFTVYNDGIHLIKEHPQDFAEGVFSAANEFRSGPMDIAIRGFANLIRAKKVVMPTIIPSMFTWEIVLLN